MDLINSWITALSNSDMTGVLTTCLVAASVVLVVALFAVMSTLNKATQSLLNVRLTGEQLDEQLKHLEEMLIATKFLTLRPEVFADEHETKTPS